MAILRWIEFWPSGGWEGQRWTDDAATDALVKTACRVSAVYGDALGDEKLEGRCSSLRFFSHLHDEAVVQLQVGTDEPDDWETAVVLVPAAVAGLSASDRGLLVLDLIHEAVAELAAHRGWPLGAVERVRARVLAQGLEYGWSSPWKASPDRSMAARLVFSVADDGLGRAAIEVNDRVSDDLLARSSPVLAYNSLVNFRASARTLRWASGMVQFVPRPGSPHGEEVASLDPTLRESHPAPRIDDDDHAVRAPVPKIVRASCGSHVEDRTPGVHVFLGFGLGLLVDDVPDLEGSLFSERVELEIYDRLRSGEAGIDGWLDGLPVEIVLEYHLPGQVDAVGAFGIRLRRTAKRLGIVVLRDGSWFARVRVDDSVVGQEVSQVVEQVMTALDSRVTPR